MEQNLNLKIAQCEKCGIDYKTYQMPIKLCPACRYDRKIEMGKELREKNKLWVTSASSAEA